MADLTPHPEIIEKDTPVVFLLLLNPFASPSLLWQVRRKSHLLSLSFSFLLLSIVGDSPPFFRLLQIGRHQRLLFLFFFPLLTLHFCFLFFPFLPPHRNRKREESFSLSPFFLPPPPPVRIFIPPFFPPFFLWKEELFPFSLAPWAPFPPPYFFLLSQIGTANLFSPPPLL